MKENKRDREGERMSENDREREREGVNEKTLILILFNEVCAINDGHREGWEEGLNNL